MDIPFLDKEIVNLENVLISSGLIADPVSQDINSEMDSAMQCTANHSIT